jgi:HEXXH motif-containing protein
VLLLIRSILDRVEAVGHSHAVLVRDVFHTLGQIQRVNPAAVASLLEYPSVGAWAARTALLLRDGPVMQARLRYLSELVVVAAVRAGVDVAVPLAGDGTDMVLPSLGFAALGGPVIEIRCGWWGAELRTRTDRVVIPTDVSQSGAGWRPYPRITVGDDEKATFLLDVSAPDHVPTALRARVDVSDPRLVDLWRERIGSGWRLLAEHHRAAAREVDAGIAVLTPLPPPPGGHSSVTLSDAFGSVFLSLPPDTRSAALALTHELQHGKLAVLLDLLNLLDAEPGELFYAPWRDDPRPLAGLLHGTYAHLEVTRFWRRQRVIESDGDRRRYAETEFARWRVETLRTCHVMVQSGRLTSIGESFVTGMVDLLDDWCAEPVSSVAAVEASRAAGRHRARWLEVNGADHPGLTGFAR